MNICLQAFTLVAQDLKDKHHQRILLLKLMLQGQDNMDTQALQVQQQEFLN